MVVSIETNDVDDLRYILETTLIGLIFGLGAMSEPKSSLWLSQWGISGVSFWDGNSTEDLVWEWIKQFNIQTAAFQLVVWVDASFRELDPWILSSCEKSELEKYIWELATSGYVLMGLVVWEACSA